MTKKRFLLSVIKFKHPNKIYTQVCNNKAETRHLFLPQTDSMLPMTREKTIDPSGLIAKTIPIYVKLRWAFLLARSG